MRAVLGLLCALALPAQRPPILTANDLKRELQSVDNETLPDTVFRAERRLRPILRTLLNDPQAASGARYLLALIGDPKDVQLIASLPPPPEGAIEFGDWRGTAQTRQLSHPNLETAAKLVAQALDSKTWESNKAPRYNEAGDKALIDLIFLAGRDRLTYTATFHKTGRTWTLRNVFETLQELLPPPIPKQLTIAVVDGLNRPLPAVTIDIECSSNQVHLTTDANGLAHGVVNREVCLSASLGKLGYQSYSTGLLDRYVLKRQLTGSDAQRLINSGNDGVRELLASDNPSVDDAVFKSEKQLRPILRSLLKEPALTMTIRDLLAVIADPEDIRLLLQLDTPGKERWRYTAAAALLHPTTEEEWNFLLRCGRNDFQDLWVKRGAIQSLHLNGSPRAQSILKSLHITPRPSPALSNADLETAAKTIAQSLGFKTWEGNDPPRFNHADDKALIDMNFQSGWDALTYTATFHKAEQNWVLHGVHQSMQAFSPRNP